MMSIIGASDISKMDIGIQATILRAARKFPMLARCGAVSSMELRLDESIILALRDGAFAPRAMAWERRKILE
jgi:hypothetical protein